MRKFYSNTKITAFKFLILVALLLVGDFVEAQVRVPFTQRTSQYTPLRKIYNIRGDFAMFGNTSMTLQNYGDETANSNNQMIYVDVDNDPNTLNSSSATLQLSTENGAIPTCSHIIYAGLYWTGRSSDASTSPNTFTVTKNGVTKNYDKHIVSLKGPGAAAYTTVTASPNEIYYPTTTDGFMYSAYAEVTDYVQAHGIGSYTVADMALKEGNGGSTGYYGGWGMIVVYENTQMKYRDVTIFDGHAYVAGNITADYEIPVSGFHTVQAGPVNLKLGVMAGEGDRNINGDKLEIKRWDNLNWKKLEHPMNGNNNFFNSTIYTGGNTRNPNLLNNTGLDISSFYIENDNNQNITNNQTSTSFRYGTNQDTYVIFAFAMAVDAYIPEPEGNLITMTINGLPVINGALTAHPGDEVEYKIFVRNRGTEPVLNSKLTVPIPYNTTFVSGSLTKNVYFLPLPLPNTVMYNPLLGANGSIVWDIGTLPLPALSSTLLGDVTFKLKITEDCTLLKNATCQNVAAVNGTLSGLGAITGTIFNDKSLIQGYQTEGPCVGQEILAPLLIQIDAMDYVNANCQGTPPVSSYAFCSPGPNIPITSISGGFPAGSRFYNSYPVTPATTEYTINNPFPSTVGTVTYYAVPPGSVAGCYFQFTITVTTVNSQATTSNVTYCVGSSAQPLTATASNPDYTLYYYTSPTGVPQPSITPSTATAGTTTYYVSEGWSATCLGPKKPITVTVYPAPTITAPANTTIQGCGTTSLPSLPFSAAPTTITLAQFNSAGGTLQMNGNPTYTLSYVDSATGTCPTVVTRTFSVNSACGNVSATQTITVQDTTPPVLGPLPGTTTVSCTVGAPSFATPTATDNCSEVTLTSQKYTTPGQCAGSYTVLKIWTAVDACGNTATTSQTIIVTDNVAPVIDPLPGPTTISCTDTPQFAVATATDVCESTISLTYVDVTTPDGCPNSYTITRTWTAADGCGNTSTASQVIHVVDNIAPVISALPAPSTVSCTSGSLQFETPTATDNCAGTVTLTFADVTTPGACSGSYSVKRTWTATDACGNSSTAFQVINVNDTTAPVISALPDTTTINCPATPQFATPTASDSCGSATLTFADVTTPGSCTGTYSVTRTWTATDSCGNTATAMQTINVQDVTPPVIDPLPDPITLTCTSTDKQHSPNFVQATAHDTCSDVTLTFVDVTTNGNCAGTFSVTRTWTATDACGNTATATQTISYEDTVAPLIAALPAPSVINCPAVPQFAVATATDECGSAINLTFADTTIQGSCTGTYTVIRTWTAMDACGNSSTASQTIAVQDVTPPVISTPASNLLVECDGQGNSASLQAWLASNGGASASDACSDVTWTNDFSTLSADCSAAVTVTFTATDACGNASTTSATFTVNDTTAPVAPAAPADVTVS
ncbi:MAG: hypothetical protein EOO51_13610, partial [Flavobacterium sp.]